MSDRNRLAEACSGAAWRTEPQWLLCSQQEVVNQLRCPFPERGSAFSRRTCRRELVIWDDWVFGCRQWQVLLNADGCVTLLRPENGGVVEHLSWLDTVEWKWSQAFVIGYFIIICNCNFGDESMWDYKEHEDCTPEEMNEDVVYHNIVILFAIYLFWASLHAF